MKVIWYNPFLSWLILTVLTHTGVFWAWHSGIFNLLLASDFTRISIGLFIVFVFLNVILGLKAYKLQSFINSENYPDPVETANFYDGFDLWNYVVAIFPYVGFIGTVIGLANLMQTSTTGVDLDADAIKVLMQHVGQNSGAALYPTLIGGMGHLIIRTHVKILTHTFMKQRYASE